MSKNISVKVDGEATNLTVDKLRTNKQGGESMDWSPESDTDVSNLRVWRNGTYTADDMGVFGFDSIYVDITGHGGAGAELVGDPHTGESVPNDITIKEGNISRTMSGVQCLKVDKQGSGKQQFFDIETGTLSVTKEGTYKAKNDRKYAYTSVTVNVSGGGGGGGVDTLPDEIRVTTAPTKNIYNDGEIIDYSGIQVKAYYQNSLWVNMYYPNGIIPINELVFSINTASIDPNAPREYTDGEGLVAASFVCNQEEHWISAGGFVGNSGYICPYKLGSLNGKPATISCVNKISTIFMTRYYVQQSEDYRLAVAGYDGAARFQFCEYDAGNSKGWVPRYAGIPDTKQKFQRALYYEDDEFSLRVPFSNKYTVDKSINDLEELPYKQTLPIEWLRPADGLALETHVDITVNSNE